jgi:hypothetical protein
VHVPAPRGALVFLVMVVRRLYINRSATHVDNRAPSAKNRATCTVNKYAHMRQYQGWITAWMLYERVHM